MLDMGFADDIESILDAHARRAPDGAVLGDDAAAHQRASPSATSAIRCGSRSAAADAEPSARPWSARAPTWCSAPHKPAALGRILDIEAPTAALVFCRTRTEVDQLTETMNGRGYRAEALHGGMDQAQRDRVMGRLRDGTAELLSPPTSPPAGSTSTRSPTSSTTTCRRPPRATCTASVASGGPGARASAITLAEPREQRLLANIERLTKQKISDREGADGRRPARPADRADRRRRPRGARRRRPRRLQRRPRRARRASDNDARHRRWPRSSSSTRPAARALDEPEIPEYAERDRPARGREYGDRDGGTPERGVRSNVRAATGRPRSCTSASAARAASARATWSARSPTRADLSGREIGPIRITEHFSVVGVPAASVDRVIDSMSSAVVRGKKVAVRQYTERSEGASSAERDDRPFRGGRTSFRPERGARAAVPNARPGRTATNRSARTAAAASPPAARSAATEAAETAGRVVRPAARRRG